MRIYSEYLNHKNISETRLKEEAKQIEQWMKKIVDIGNPLNDYVRPCFKKYFEDPIRASKYLLKGILSLYDHQLHNLEYTESTPYRPSRYKLFESLSRAIEQTNSELKAGQTGAFHNEFIDHVYEQRITSFPRFRFNSDSQVTYQPESYLDLILDFYFPFNNEKFDGSQNCVNASDLPPFFQQKGKHPK